MAFEGLHVVCGYLGAGENVRNTHPVFGSTVWSETLATGGTTTQAAPVGPGRPVFRVYAAAASYVVLTPEGGDASKAVSTSPAEARVLIPATTTVDLYADVGDKLTWLAIA